VQPPAVEDLSGSVAGGGDSGELGDAGAFTMPDLKGKSVAEAKAATGTMNVRWTDLSGAPIAGDDAQRVCQQSPAAGTPVIGDSIALKVADSC
jgi:beta-lactam-binding protein with PASTA domain